MFFYHQVKKVILKVKFLSKPKTAQIIKKQFKTQITEKA
jgi:hypothetical protein